MIRINNQRRKKKDREQGSEYGMGSEGKVVYALNRHP